MKSHLFLHMGPGANAEVERKCLGDLFPQVEFWDQPHAQNFQELVEVSEKKLISLSQNLKAPIQIVAHSFGGHIALELLKRQAPLIRGLRFLNAAWDPFHCFINLGTALGFSQAELSQAEAATLDQKISFIIKVSSFPGFAELYWDSKTKLQELLPVLTTATPLNPQVFVQVFSDFKNRKTDFNPLKTEAKKVELIYSEKDALINFEADIRPWMQIFPQAELIALPRGGHNPHLESSEAVRLVFN